MYTCRQKTKQKEVFIQLIFGRFDILSSYTLKNQRLTCTTVYVYTSTCMYTVNQLLFSMTLFHDFSEMNWFAAINFQDQALSAPGLRQEIFRTIRLL